MPPAARVTDPTTHGAPLSPGPGSINVMIGGMPAWRALIDQHACPAASVSGADGVGSVVMGSPTVLINNMMACRQMDIVVEKPGLAMGPANPILMGEPTVIIGEGAVGLALIQAFINAAKAFDMVGLSVGAAAMKQAAIDEAIKCFNIDTSKTKSVTYDPSVRGEAITSKDAKVKIGDKGFRSPEWLGSSVGHEVEVHVNEQAAKGKWYTGHEGTNIQEVQAYDYEIANSKRYGTSPTDVADLQARRKSYHDGLSADNQKQVDGSPPSYDLPPGHEDD